MGVKGGGVYDIIRKEGNNARSKLRESYQPECCLAIKKRCVSKREETS